MAGLQAAQAAKGIPPTVVDPLPSPQPLLAIRRLTKDFRSKPGAVSEVDLQVWPGELVVVLGANGSGKSTLLRCAVKLMDPSSGSVWLCGRDLAQLNGRALRDARRAAGMVFQQGHLVGRRSALRNAASGSLGRHRSPAVLAGRLPESELRLAAEALERVGLAHLSHQRADTLSGGQAQRVAIARTLVQQPKVMLADEPVASLDPDGAEEVMATLARLAGDGLGVVVVLHQPDLALRHAHRIVGMRDGSVVFDRPGSDVSPEQVAALYRGESR